MAVGRIIHEDASSAANIDSRQNSAFQKVEFRFAFLPHRSLVFNWLLFTFQLSHSAVLCHSENGKGEGLSGTMEHVIVVA